MMNFFEGLENILMENNLDVDSAKVKDFLIEGSKRLADEISNDDMYKSNLVLYINELIGSETVLYLPDIKKIPKNFFSGLWDKLKDLPKDQEKKLRKGFLDWIMYGEVIESVKPELLGTYFILSTYTLLNPEIRKTADEILEHMMWWGMDTSVKDVIIYFGLMANELFSAETEFSRGLKEKHSDDEKLSIRANFIRKKDKLGKYSTLDPQTMIKQFIIDYKGVDEKYEQMYAELKKMGKLNLFPYAIKMKTVEPIRFIQDEEVLEYMIRFVVTITSVEGEQLDLYERYMVSIWKAIKEDKKEAFNVILRKGITVYNTNSELLYPYLINAVSALEDIGSIYGFEKWVDEGIPSFRREKNGEKYLNRTSQRSRKVIKKVKSKTWLDEIYRSLGVFAIAISERNIEIKASPADAPFTDGARIFLPKEISYFRRGENNKKAFYVLSAHESGHIRYGTFLFDIDLVSEKLKKEITRRYHEK